MAIALKNGISGVKQRDYRVWIASNDYNFEFASIIEHLYMMMGHFDAQEYGDAYSRFALALSKMQEVGECRADSIDVGIEDGNSIEGNTLGKIVLGKNGTFTAELINSTPSNVNYLSLLDNKDVLVVLAETEGSDEFYSNGTIDEHILSRDSHKIIIIGNYSAILANNPNGAGKSLSVSHRETGSNGIVVTLSIEDSCPDAVSFRKIVSVPYSIESAILALNGDEITSYQFNAKWTPLAESVVDGYLVSVSTSAIFSSHVIGYDHKYVDGAEESKLTIESLAPDVDYYYRIIGIKDGKKVTSYSNVVNVTTAS